MEMLLYHKKGYKGIIQKTFPISSDNVFPSLWQSLEIIRVEVSIFEAIQESCPFHVSS